MLFLSRVFAMALRRPVNQKLLIGYLYFTVPMSLSRNRYLSVPTKRDLAIQNLSEEVFSRGNMHLKNVDNLSALPEGLHSFPEVCFIGKPNVGKSTLISCLLHNPKLGKGGRIAGTTRLLQFFNVGDALLLVDTPGYGGWGGRKLHLKQSQRANAFAILFRYLALRKERNLKRVYWLIEASATTPISIQARDEEILTFLRREGVLFSVILTKIDRHRRYYLDQYHKSDVLANNRPTFEGHTRSTCSRISTPSEGLRRNVQEVCAFLGTDSVPIIGVSANRQCPARCENLNLLQHDILHYCTQELGNNSQLRYTDLHELSYFPPSGKEIENIQKKYPIEAFIVPQDNRTTLKKMVDMHEDEKARYMASNSRFGFFTTLDAEANHLLDSRQYSRIETGEDHQHRVKAEPHVSLASTSVGTTASQLYVSESALEAQASPLVRSFSCPPLSGDGNVNKNFRQYNSKDTRDTDFEVVSRVKCETKSSMGRNSFSLSCDEEPSSSSSISTALPSLEQTKQTVMAINGMQIPRSMILSSVEELAKTKDDELPWFEARSGAYAYEKIISQDHLDSPSVPFFVEHDQESELSEAKLDSIQRVRVCSSSQTRKKRLLEKYLDRKRKDRSIYMHAEGYMCPWLASAGQVNRQAVLGLNSIIGGFQGKGVVFKGLKRTGFGGKSYSAKTLRNRGRATKKTGFWAA